MSADVIPLGGRAQAYEAGPILPDNGPWRLLPFQGQVLALSQASGLYVVEGAKLRKVELAAPPSSPPETAT